MIFIFPFSLGLNFMELGTLSNPRVELKGIALRGHSKNKSLAKLHFLTLLHHVTLYHFWFSSRLCHVVHLKMSNYEGWRLLELIRHYLNGENEMKKLGKSHHFYWRPSLFLVIFCHFPPLPSDIFLNELNLS